MATARELFDDEVQHLSAAERLKLASLILQDLTKTKGGEFNDVWTEEDYQDISSFSMKESKDSV